MRLAGWQNQDHSIRPPVRSDVCVHVFVGDRAGYTECHLAVAPHTQRYPSLCVGSELPDHRSRSLHKPNITKNNHTYTSDTTNPQMFCENTLIAVCGCQSNRFFSPPLLISSLSFSFMESVLPQPALWCTPSFTDQSKDARRCSLRLQQTVKVFDKNTHPGWKLQLVLAAMMVALKEEWSQLFFNRARGAAAQVLKSG